MTQPDPFAMADELVELMEHAAIADAVTNIPTNIATPPNP